MSAVENFPILLSDAEEESSAVPPCFSHEGINVRSTESGHLTPATRHPLLSVSFCVLPPTNTGVFLSSTFISATATSISSH